jgi:L-serine dehydratase
MSSTTPSVFDIIGPIMVGPSSSHTAGAVRLGALARAIFGEQPQVATIALHGSFAATGEGHGTQVALIAGLLGLRCDDPRIPDAFELAASLGLQFTFEEARFEGAHPNTARFILERPDQDKVMTITGSSIGGGNVVVTHINDFEVEATGDLPVLVISHKDEPGVINTVSGVLAAANINIATMKVSRERRGARALMVLECDVLPDPGIIEQVEKVAQVRKARIVPAV